MTYNDLIANIVGDIKKDRTSPWVITDPDCAQMRKILPDGIYVFAEFHDSPDGSDNVTMVRSFVDLSDYSDGELWFYGSMYYNTPEEFEAQGADIMAECVAENTWEVVWCGTAQQVYDLLCGKTK